VTSDRRRPSSDADLRFATWPGRPAWLVSPVLSLLDGRAFAELTPREGVEFLGVLAQLQVVRSAIACIPVLGTAAVLDVTGAATSWSSLMWAVTFTGVLVVPMY
jgi:hypothetical protein